LSAIKIVCSHCGRWLAVSESAPARLICPNCLHPVENAAAGSHPVPVLPLATQVRADTVRASVVLLLLLPLLIIWGVVNVFAAMGWSSAIGPIVIFGAIAALTLYVWLVLPRGQRVTASTKPAEPQTKPSAARLQPFEPVLDYAMPEQRRALRPPKPEVGCIEGMMWVFLGFVIGGGISAIAWIGMYDYLERKAPAAIFVVPGTKFIIAVTLLVTWRRYRFAGIGLLLSIGLGALIFLGSLMAHCHI
jgi:hypothetical protein